MRINNIALRNYRQYQELNIALEKKPDKKDLHIFVGLMGTGKTNFLNALNWCLYGDEPYLSLTDQGAQQLPKFNLRSKDSLGEGEQDSVEVQIHASLLGKTYIFSRREKIKVTGSIPVTFNEEFEVKVSDEPIFTGDEARNKVERFVPKNIREFFFFDGERLDNYFKEATGQNISNSVEAISQTILLDKLNDNLQKIIKDFTKEAGRLNPDIEETRKNIEQKETELKNKEKEIDTCTKQIKIAKDEISKYTDKLKGIPQVEDLVGRIEAVKSQKKEKEDLIKTKIDEKNSLLFDYGKSILLFSAIKNAIDFVRDKRARKELPPPVDKKLLETILNSSERICLCKKKIEINSPEDIELNNLLKQISLSTETATNLAVMENSLDQTIHKIHEFKNIIYKATTEINMVKKDLDSIVSEIEDIDRKIAGYNIERIKEWRNELKKYEEQHEFNQKKLGVLEDKKPQTEAELSDLKSTLERELKNEDNVKLLQRYIEFSEKALKVLNKSQGDIKHKIRNKIQHKCSELFLDLHWKKNTYKTVIIGEDYSIKPIHKDDYECLATLSGGEREILALAFTLALHDTTGFHSPLVIDRPFAMASGQPIEEIAKALKRISETRQVILMLTPNDYSSDVSAILNPDASNKFRYRLDSDEKALLMEAI